MNNTMTAAAAAHEPINYLDKILNEEENRCDSFRHQWRNFSISRSGRFKSKNKKRDVVDGKLFDATAAVTTTTAKSTTSVPGNNTGIYKEIEKTVSRQYPSASGSNSTMGNNNNRNREKSENYKRFYETNL